MKKSEVLYYDLVGVSSAWVDLVDHLQNRVHGMPYERIGDVLDVLSEVRDEIIWELVESLREEDRDEKRRIKNPSSLDSYKV